MLHCTHVGLSRVKRGESKVDMGIAGRRALVCASSKGLGRGCAEALAAEGVDLVLNARSADTLEVTAEEIRAVHGVNVTTVPADVTTDTGRAAILEQAGDLDIVINNAGGPPPGSRSRSADALHACRSPWRSSSPH